MNRFLIYLFSIFTMIVYILQYLITGISVFAALFAILIHSKYFLHFVHISAILAAKPRVSWLGREHLIHISFFENVFKHTDCIPAFTVNIKRSKNAIQESILKANHIIIATIPEVTRIFDGNLKDFKKDFLFILADTEINILPVTINRLIGLKPKPGF